LIFQSNKASFIEKKYLVQNVISEQRNYLLYTSHKKKFLGNFVCATIEYLDVHPDIFSEFFEHTELHLYTVGASTPYESKWSSHVQNMFLYHLEIKKMNNSMLDPVKEKLIFRPTC
jgi:hypothetical protein